MPPLPQQAQDALRRLLHERGCADADTCAFEPVSGGASGRCIARCCGMLGIYWTDARADNNSFLPAAHGLAAAGLRVPAILAEANLGNGCGACLVQDLGRIDLLSMKHAGRAERIDAYEKALRTLAPLYRLEPDWEMQPPFDHALYRWEQGYFAQHLLGRHLGRDAAAFMDAEAPDAMARWLAELPRVPVHRDCQSQNIMLHGGAAWLIDFQGMRAGRWEYDLASLLYDPYMELADDERDELLQLWLGISGQEWRADVYYACAMQRLMQALGAYGNIGYNQGNAWYLEMIPPGLRALRHAAGHTPANSPAHAAAQCILSCTDC